MWDDVGDHQLFGPNMIKGSEENVKIRDRLKVTQSRHKSYTDSKKRKEIVYEIGEQSMSSCVPSARS